VTTQYPKRRDIRGALNGSRFIEQPHIQVEVQSTLDFITGPSPVLVEVGFDHGRRLHSTALHNPRWQVLGIEVRKVRVEEAQARATREGIENIRAWRFDARTVFANVLPDASVDVVEVLFPTPWWHPGVREKRLLVDPLFVDDVARVLKPGGLFYVATDVDSYESLIRATFAQTAHFEMVCREIALSRRPECHQLSRREWRCQKDGIAWSCFYAMKRTS